MYPTEKKGKYLGLENLSDQELRLLLWKDFAAFGEEGPDEELISSAMLVMQQRAGDRENSAEAVRALAEFHRNHDLNQTRRRPRGKHRENRKPVYLKVKRACSALAATACALLIFCAPVAHGSTILETMVNWKQSTFSFPDQKETGTVAVLTTPDYLKTVDAISSRTGASLLPTWYPEDTEVNCVEDNSSDSTLDYCILFSRGEQDFAISVLVYEEGNRPTSVYEKNKDSGSACYTDSGMPYYLMKNMEKSVAVWQGKTSEYCILGFLTTEEIQHMMNSIRMGDET